MPSLIQSNPPPRAVVNQQAVAFWAAIRAHDDLAVGKEIFRQIGTSTNGGHVYVGAKLRRYSVAPYLFNQSVGGPSASYMVAGLPIMPTGGLMLMPNTIKPTAIFVSLEPSDTYTVRLVAVKNPAGGRLRVDWYPRFIHLLRTVQGPIKTRGELLYEHEGVYNDSLQSVVESVYDHYLRDFEGSTQPRYRI